MTKNKAPENKELKVFIREQIRMLRNDFLIRITPEEVDYMRKLQTEIAVENYVQSLIMHKL